MRHAMRYQGASPHHFVVGLEAWPGNTPHITCTLHILDLALHCTALHSARRYEQSILVSPGYEPTGRLSRWRCSH